VPNGAAGVDLTHFEYAEVPAKRVAAKNRSFFAQRGSRSTTNAATALRDYGVELQLIASHRPPWHAI
jgi:hypothetical protein